MPALPDYAPRSRSRQEGRARAHAGEIISHQSNEKAAKGKPGRGVSVEIVVIESRSCGCAAPRRSKSDVARSVVMLSEAKHLANPRSARSFAALRMTVREIVVGYRRQPSRYL